ncbi:MAG: S8 family peptidase [Gemmatimonadetes bacterium]|nr:S8 family peptidase [Gemmatimonadota bacterium]
MQNKLFTILAAAALAACGDQDPVALAPAGDMAPLLSAAPGAGIEDAYIVVLREGADPRSVAALVGASPRHVYGAALNGFAGTLNAGQVRALRRDPNVAFVEQDQAVRAFATQTGATWGIDRTDQRSLPLSGTFTYAATGAGVTAYIIDTGIDYAHVEFGNRARFGFDAFLLGNGDDCNGHGTHVAGTVGGTLYGIAKQVALVAVRVLDCTGAGSTSGVIAGVDWVTRNHRKPAVANMSLGGGASSSLDQAVDNSIKAGVSYAIAAGNGDALGNAQDACTVSPARVAAAMTIGATDKTDAKASWSNYGNCVDWFAPGVGITSAWFGLLNNDIKTISGTSMATPHVAGVAALYLQGNPGASPATVTQALRDATTKGLVTSSRTANNHLLYTAW